MPRIINSCRAIIGSPSKNKVVIEGLTDLFKKHGSTPKVTSASLIPVGSGQVGNQLTYCLKVDLSQIDFDSVEKKSYHSAYLVNLNGDGCVDNIKDLSPFTNLAGGQGVSNELGRCTSYFGKLTAIVRDTTKDGKNSQSLEIWSKKGLLKTLNGEKEKIFSKINMFETFGSMCWSLDESRLAFIAEKYTKTSGYFEEKKKTDELKDDVDEKTTGQGEEYLHKQDWGEQLVGTCHPILCIVDTADDFKIRTIDLQDISCSECFWIDNKTIGFVGIKEESNRLGLIYCPIRKSCLYKCDLRDPESEPVIIFGQDFSLAVRSPRVSNDSSKIVFLSNPPSGPHFQASSLNILNLQDMKVKTLIDIGGLQLNEPDTPTEIGTFYSLYLPEHCWTSDNKKIIVNPDLVYRQHIFLIDAESGQTQRVHVDGGEAVSVLDVRDDLIVINLTQPNIGYNLHIGKLVNNQLVHLKPVDVDLVVKQDKLKFRCDKIVKNESGQQLITCILVGPEETFGKPTPTILCPHGGPHVSFLATYMPRVALMAEVGFKVILVNYRGSTGINSAHEKFLCGKIGTTDVADCMEALKYYIDQNEVDKDQVCLYGGSHGGFLVTHLIGQHSEFGFRACCALNPVTDLVTGFQTSDIADWHLVEGIGLLEPYQLTTVPSPDLLKPLLAKSPIYHVDKVKTPVLMGLGTEDKRVPMCEGLAYHYALKARGVETKCLVYKDNHNIGKTSHDLDVEMNCILWFLDHLASTKS